MNRALLLNAMASLIMLSAGANEKGSGNANSLGPQFSNLAKSQILTREMKINAPAQMMSGPHKSSGPLMPHYYRPAGAFFSGFFAYNGQGLWTMGDYTYLQVKPYSDYTYYGFVEGADENDFICWDYSDNVNGDSILSYTDWYDIGMYSVPTLYVYQNGDWSTCDSFMYPYYYHDDGGGPVVVGGTRLSPWILSAPTPSTIYEDELANCEFLFTSKTMVPGGSNGDNAAVFSRYSGPLPWGDNDFGWWFGKNASHIDGIAQAFEKPQHPYLLKNIYLQAHPEMVVLAPVMMTCKVYKMDAIPDYQEVGCVELPAEPGELVATGKATVTPTTGEALNGLITFTLFAEDPEVGLPYECQPTIDYPILVCIDGYNDPGMEDLVDFSAFVSIDDQVDEGYGELAYLKTGIFETEVDLETGDTVYNEDGSPVTSFTGEYKWRGLNNYFSNGTQTMKTGLTIFIGLEHPYLAFKYDWEDGEYYFPNEGGPLNDIVHTYIYPDSTVWETEGIAFRSWIPCHDGDWTVDCDGKALPGWLEIELTDVEDNGENIDYTVIAHVTAQPLPAGTDYREAIVRFAIPGDYKYFKFMQGMKKTPSGDVNGDTEVNIADVNCLIDIILGAENKYGDRADVNDDGEINIADVNSVIDVILGS